jgi:hypothetical protein
MAYGQAQPKMWSSQEPAAREEAAGNFLRPLGLEPGAIARSYSLAFFIVPERQAAIHIVVGALTKLAVQFRRDLKRQYWRDKHPTRSFRRITWSPIDMLQWLLMFEAEDVEKAQERDNTQSTEDMLVRYIKNVVGWSTAVSSFYVHMGVMRLLHSYSTLEAVQAYELVNGRTNSTDEYRRVKGVLMEKVKQRFSQFLIIKRGRYGELRFEGAENQNRWIGLVRECMAAFTPWSTRDLCSREPSFGLDSRQGRALQFEGLSFNDNEAEMNACHMFIDPLCFERLTRALSWNPPETMLNLPRFVMPDNDRNDNNSTSDRVAPELSSGELDQIRSRIAEYDMRRQTIEPRHLRIEVDRIQRAEFDLTAGGQIQIAVEEGASIVEMYGEDRLGDLVLATHFISYDETGFEDVRAYANLATGKLRIAISPAESKEDGTPRALVTLRYQQSPKVICKAVWNNLKAASWGLVRSHVFVGAAVAVLAIGLAGAFYHYKLHKIERGAPSSRKSSVQEPHRSILSQLLVRDELRVRGMESVAFPRISLPVQSVIIALQCPLSEPISPSGYHLELKSFGDERILLTEDLALTQKTATGPIVEMDVPSSVLEPGVYYTIDVRPLDTNDHSRVINHFTFEAISDSAGKRP